MNGARRPRFCALQRDDIGSVDPHALKIPARRAEYSLPESALSPFQAEPTQFGFHNSDRCPNCVTREAGYEFWGENGHMQGSASNRAGMVHWIGLKAKQQWRTKGHRLMGYRFITGGTLRYLGGYLAAASQPEETHK